MSSFFIILRTNLKSGFEMPKYEDIFFSYLYLFDHIHNNVFSEIYAETKNDDINI